MLFIFLMLAVVICVSGLIFGATMLIRGDNDQIHDRLHSLTQNGGRGAAKTPKAESSGSLLRSPLDDVPNAVEAFVEKFLNIRKFIEQSGLPTMTVTKFVAMTAILAGVGGVIAFVASPWISIVPVGIFCGAVMPFLYVWWVRRGRLRKFGAQLPEAIDLMCQALRAGQSLPAGIQLVASQMAEPLGPEFARAYEQQNLGVPLTDSLREMSDRIPSLDLQFFTTSVVLQRQTGGDLAEILDKIANLCRERFAIWGQIQALTGEGRLSGIVLLALPPALFGVMLKLNYDYVMMLFEDPLGQKMLVFGIVMQILGAIAIKKIITIKV